jgi:hypothetical protein
VTRRSITTSRPGIRIKLAIYPKMAHDMGSSAAALTQAPVTERGLGSRLTRENESLNARNAFTPIFG